MTDNARLPVMLLARPAAGGIRSHLLHLIERLNRDRFEIVLAAPQAFIDSLPQDLPEFSTYSVPITAKPSLLDPIAAARVAQIARTHGTIVHAHGIRAGFIAALAKRIADFPLVVTYHNVPPCTRLGRFALESIGKQASAIITVSRAIAQEIGDNRAIVMPNGIDLSVFQNLDREEARDQLRIAHSEFVVACVARLSREKGVDILLRAALLMPEVTVLIAGSGPERGRLEASAAPNVRFLGYVEHPGPVFAASDIAVIPSRSEGQGIVALEAMACGAAVAAANVGGLSESVQDNVTGLLVPPENPPALAAAIRLLKDDPTLRSRLPASGRDWVTANGDIRQRITEVEQIYEQVRRG